MFEDLSFPIMIDHLGDDCDYVSVTGAVTKTIKGIFNEFVGAIDELTRCIITIKSDATLGVASPRRGDQLTVAGNTWYVIDIRSDNAGTHELRCDRSMEDV